MAGCDYGITIGIDRYPDLKEPLSGAVADATAFRTWLVESASVPEANTALITSPRRGRPRPVHDEIDEVFDRFLEAASHQDAGRLYVYFAGHGSSVSHDHVNLLLANATRTLLNRGLDAPEYHRALEGGPFEQQVYFYDCCRTRDPRARGLGPGFLPHARGKDDAPLHVSQLVLYAVLFGRRSSERIMNGGEARGLFTHVLLQGLQGGAAIRYEERYAVTGASLRNFLRIRLDQLAAEEGILQTPSVQDVGADQPIVLLDDATPWQMRVELSPFRPITRAVIVRGTGSRPVRAVVRDGCAHFDLPPGLYGASSEPPGEYLQFEVEPAKPVHRSLEEDLL